MGGPREVPGPRPGRPMGGNGKERSKATRLLGDQAAPDFGPWRCLWRVAGWGTPLSFKKSIYRHLTALGLTSL